MAQPTRTDTFDFNEQKVFQKIKDNLPKNETQNLLTVQDDLLCVWDSKNSSLLTLNWRAAKSADQNYQILTPSSSPNFSVNKVLLSSESSFVAVAGQRGVSILELPRRWGGKGQFQNGKENIMCKTYSLDEHLFQNNTHLQVLQIRWHPGSPTDSHLMVLLSDNSIRIYDESILKHVWRVGPLPYSGTSDINLSYLSGLGDTAVDFDIAPPRVLFNSPDIDIMETINESVNENNSLSRSIISQSDQKRVEWPILVLRGNGTIFVLCAGIDTEKPPLQGPLTVNPQKNDNYGDDSCSILLIPTLPPTVIVADSSGKLHHALLVENNLDNATESFEESQTFLQNEWELYVLETVELELGLTPDPKKSYTCPIYLKRDIINDHRYFCYHNAGLHAISIGFAQQLQEYVEANDLNLPNLDARSRAEYILCTNAFALDRTNAISGFGLLQSPSGLLVLLASGQVVSLDLILDKGFIPASMVANMALEAPFNGTGDHAKKELKGSFDVHIRNILKADSTQPLIKLDKNNPPTSQQSFELLFSAIQVLREQYFMKHEKAHHEIQKRVKTLQFLKQQQKDEIDHLQYEKELIQDKATKLAEMQEDITEKQRNLFKRVQEVVRLATIRLPTGSSSEKEFAQQIHKIATATKILDQNMIQVRTKIESQEKQFEHWNQINNDSAKILPHKQELAIQEILKDHTLHIENQVNDVKKLSAIINL